MTAFENAMIAAAHAAANAHKAHASGTYAQSVAELEGLVLVTRDECTTFLFNVRFCGKYPERISVEVQLCPEGRRLMTDMDTKTGFYCAIWQYLDLDFSVVKSAATEDS